MDVIAGTAFGIRTNSYKNPDEPFISSAQQVFGTSTMNPILLLASKYRKYNFFIFVNVSE